MDRSGKELANLLSTLKERSGHSYATLARKTHLSRSSVHRYCNGEIIPAEFGSAERIARACAASRSELADLYRHWAKATSGKADDRAPEKTPVSAATAGQTERIADTPLDAPRRRQARDLIAATVAVIVLITFCATALTSSTPHAAGPAGAPRTVAAAWTQAPTPVPGNLFGMTMNSSTGAMPTFQIDAVRLWDSRTRWSNIQPRRGEFDWSILDRLVDGANRAGLPVLFTMGGTPSWASPNGPRTAYDDGSRTAPPDDLADWNAFVRAVAGRYRDRIDGYELWVMGNDPRFYSGDLPTLVEMTRMARVAITELDPGAIVVCPSMGRLWEPEGRLGLERFAQLRGYDHCDAAGVKLYQRSASDPPEAMLELTDEIDRSFHRGGAHPPLWSTGTTYEIPLQEPLDEDTAADFAARFFLVGMYARYQRMYFYNWGGTKIPIVMQPEGSSPTRAALHVEELRRWVHGALIHSCGEGTAAGLPVGVWRCTFSRDGVESMILWTSVGTARLTAPRGVEVVHRLDGTAGVADGVIEISTRPVLLTP